MKKLAFSTTLSVVLCLSVLAQNAKQKDSIYLRPFLASAQFGLTHSSVTGSHLGGHFGIVLHFKRFKPRFEISGASQGLFSLLASAGSDVTTTSHDIGYAFITGDRQSLTPYIGWSRVNYKE